MYLYAKRDRLKAIQLTEENIDDVYRWCDFKIKFKDASAYYGDWIVEDGEGGFKLLLNEHMNRFYMPAEYRPIDNRLGEFDQNIYAERVKMVYYTNENRRR